MRGRSWCWILLTALVWLGFARTTWAAVEPAFSAVHRLQVEGAPQPLAHDVTLTCREHEGDWHPQCDGELRWILPASEAPRRAVLTVDNGVLGAATADGRTLERAAADDNSGDWRLDVLLPASSEPLELIVEVTLAPRFAMRCGMGYVAPLVALRHHLTFKDRAIVLRFDMEAYPLEDDPPPVEPIQPQVQIRYPDGWKGDTPQDDVPYVTASWDKVEHGPVFGIGAGFHGKARTARPWFRAGYEVASLRFMLHSVTVESDLRRIAVVPSTEVGTGSLWGVIPSLSIGVGMPVRVVPNLRPGVRVLSAMSFHYVSIIGAFDVFPARHRRRREHVGNVGLQVSF